MYVFVHKLLSDSTAKIEILRKILDFDFVIIFQMENLWIIWISRKINK